MGRTAQNGDKVAVRFVAVTEEGIEAASTPEGEYLETTLGSGQFIPMLETALVGMAEGETKKFSVTKEEGFPRSEELVFELQRSELPADLEMKVGDHLMLEGPEGSNLPVKVTEMTDETVKVDANPPIAGVAMDMSVELNKIVEQAS